jgi:hypothetical protein
MPRTRENEAETSRTTRADAVHERRKANPDSEDMADPKEV